MNTKPLSLLLVLAGGLALLGGCATPSEAPSTPSTAKYTIEDTEKYVALDKATEAGVQCTGLRERVRPDGRLEVVANLRNLTPQPGRVKINCVFKDDKGFTMGDETPFQTVELAGAATETVRFTATNPAARHYTIRVRQAR